MTDLEILEVVTAQIDGFPIEFTPVGRENWQPCPNPTWDFMHFRYRKALSPLRIWCRPVDGSWRQCLPHAPDSQLFEEIPEKRTF
jgi:hypothetical protein